MTDNKIEKIRAMIVARYNYHKDNENNYASSDHFWGAVEDRYILSCIDSMREEPTGNITSEQADKLIEQMQGIRKQLGKEEPKKCMYALDDFNDEDREVTCDGCEEGYNITGIKSKHATGKLKECIDAVKKAKLNAMLDDALSKETKESWNERLDKKDFRERYKRITQSESFKKAHEGISIGDAVPVEGGEPVSKELEEASLEYWKHQLDSGEDTLRDAFKAGAKWQFERVNEALLSEVLPCFMHGGEADEVVAKLDEVLNKKK